MRRPFPIFPRDRFDSNYSIEELLSIVKKFRVFLGIAFIIVAIVYGSTLNSNSVDLQLKVFISFLTFLKGIDILIEENETPTS